MFMNRLLQRLGILIAVLAFTSAMGYGQLYVDANATGANDGSTWEDAYTDLQEALGAALEDDEIWVAAGTYVPGTDTLDYFQLVEGVRLYGGFAGTETSEGERDPEANVTILSGDVNADDVPGDSLSRLDNVFHVLLADSTITNATILDGFTISGGQSVLAGVDGIIRDSGAGLLSEGSPIVSNCIFTQNSASRGGALFAQGSDASSIKILDCEFTDNHAAFGGGVMFIGLVGGLIDNCSFENNTVDASGSAIYNGSSIDTVLNSTFTGNTANRGALFHDGSNAYYENLDFDSNEALELGASLIITGGEPTFESCTFSSGVGGVRGGVMYFFEGVAEFNNCEFTSNSASNLGGVITIQEADDDSEATFNNCSFSDNAADRGGVIYVLGGAGIFNDCDFNSNVGTTLGGAIAIQDIDAPSTINCNNCTFSAHTSGNGAAIFSFAGITEFDNCDFVNNSSESGGVGFIQGGEVHFDGCLLEQNVGGDFGGAGLTGFGASSSFTNCIFRENQSSRLGAAWWTQNDMSSNEFLNCQFIENSIEGGSSSSGNALGFGQASIGTVDSCYFEGNNNGFNPDFGSGGAIAVLGDTTIQGGSIVLGSISITRSLFIANQATVQGGAIDLSAVNATVENCVFAFNTSNAGTIINNGSTRFGSPLTLTNNTFYLNEGSFGSGLVQWENPSDTVDADASAEIQNNIFVGGDGPAYAVEDGTPTLTSNGGNLVQDESLDAAATADDMENVTEGDIALTEPLAVDFRLTSSSIAIDAGVNTDAPTVDLTGTVRLDSENTIVDAGAYEFHGFPDATDNLTLDFGINVNPTVTRDNVTLNFESDKTGDVDVMVFDYQGNRVMHIADNKVAPTFKRTMNVGHLPSGKYIVRVLTDGGIGGGKFIVTH